MAVACDGGEQGAATALGPLVDGPPWERLIEPLDSCQDLSATCSRARAPGSVMVVVMGDVGCGSAPDCDDRTGRGELDAAGARRGLT